MILKGAQFFNYACFNQQFVSLQESVNLLVGKNNAGKTALLKGVGALAALPIGGWATPSQDTTRFVGELSEYLRGHDQEPYYSMEIIFRMEEVDGVPLRTNETSWRQLVRENEVLCAYKFWFFPRRNQGLVIFDSCDLRIPGYPELQLIVSNENGLNILMYQLPQPGSQLPPLVDTRIISPGGQVVLGPDRKNRYVPVPMVDHHFDGLATLARARYVSPHRVVTPWIGIQTADLLPDNADNLAIFLQTLHGRNRRAFEKIENLVLSVFPEFTAVNPATERNQVRVTLSRRDVDRDIPLTHCGTGVEQVLAIATFVVTAEAGALLLIDEPHSFLHPTAERQLIDFLKADKTHRFVVSTHSAVFMNSVAAERIQYIEAPGRAYSSGSRATRISQILLDLGYRNSDILFYDKLVIVEGKTDKAILPVLLALAGVPSESLARVGFPTLEGVPERVRDLQFAILKYEKLVGALSQAEITRTYVLDGDRSPEDVGVLSSMRSPGSGAPVPVRFLPRTEIENYLLSPPAIEAAMREEAELTGVDVEITRNEIQRRIAELLGKNDPKLFPLQKGNDPTRAVKASALLERLYASFGNLVYDKNHSGTLIARHLQALDQPMLSELRNLVSDLSLA